jgi:hypothetical protein
MSDKDIIKRYSTIVDQLDARPSGALSIERVTK